MRELKFRAWDNTKKEWTLNIMECVSSSRGDIWLEPALKSHEVIIEQYTGLKDKNGKEIYEGDILKLRGRAYEVKFDKYGQFYIENKNYHWLENGYSFRSVDIWCADGILVEAIGNIHENQELLEKVDAKN